MMGQTYLTTDELSSPSPAAARVHKFTLILDDHERPAIKLVVGLGLNNQMRLDYHHHSASPADLELKILEDRERLVKACLNLPIQTTLAANEISRVVTAGCMDLPVEDISQTVTKHLSSILQTRNRSWHGHVNDRPWQHHLPSLPVYQWHPGVLAVRVVLHREKRGFSLEFLRRHDLPPIVRTIRRLPMPERPSNIDAAGALDRAEYKRGSH